MFELQGGGLGRPGDAPTDAGDLYARNPDPGRNGLVALLVRGHPSLQVIHLDNVPSPYMVRQAKCTAGRMDAFLALVQSRYMRGKPPHYLRDWRLSKGLTLEQVAERVEEVGRQRFHDDPQGTSPLRMTHATLSRIERYKLPYYQQLIEILAEVYGTDEGSLIMRKPDQSDHMWDLYSQLTPSDREQVGRIIETFTRKTGTDG